MMRKQMMKSALLGVTVLAASSLVQAELKANVGVTSNYVFRGASQTDDGPAVQGGVDFTHDSGIFAGIWGSNVENAAGNDGFEYDLYLGYNFKVNDKVAFDIGYITYEYTDDALDDSRGSKEIFIGASFKDFSATYYDGSPNLGRDSTYTDLKFSMPLPEKIFLHLHYGLLDQSSGDAEDASIGISKDIAGFNMSLTWSTIDYDNGSANDEDELFITISKAFDIAQ